jgi:hypothetical protein
MAIFGSEQLEQVPLERKVLRFSTTFKELTRLGWNPRLARLRFSLPHQKGLSAGVCGVWIVGQ